MKKQINQLIDKHTNKTVWGLSFVAIVAFWLFALSMTSCNKDPQPDQSKPITVQVKTEGLFIQEMKSFDPSQWQYNYNPNSYELKFTGAKGKVYTYNKTIQELKTGFAVSVLPDNYVITYQTLHAPDGNSAPLDNVLDIVINESKSINTPTDLTLTANNDDYLVVMDNNCLTASLWYTVTNNNLYFFNSPDNTFKYMYFNQEGNIIINYKDQNNETLTKTIANATKGNVYHIVSSVNGNSGINIVQMSYNMIGW